MLDQQTFPQTNKYLAQNYSGSKYLIRFALRVVSNTSFVKKILIPKPKNPIFNLDLPKGHSTQDKGRGQIRDHKPYIPEDRSKRTYYRVKTTYHSLQTIEKSSHTTYHRPQTTDHRPQTTDHRPQIKEDRPQTTYHIQTEHGPQTTNHITKTQIGTDINFYLEASTVAGVSTAHTVVLMPL